MPKKEAKSPAKNLREYKLPPVELVGKRLMPAKAKRESVKTDKWVQPISISRHEKEVIIRKGKGMALGKIPNVSAMLNKLPRRSRVLATVYSILYGRVSKKTPIKANLEQFSGVVYDDDKGREKLEDKLYKYKLMYIREVLAFFGQDPSGERDEVIKRLVDYLEKPKPSDEKYDLPATATGINKKKKSERSRSSSPAKKKKDPNAPKRNLSAYMFFCKAKRAEVAAKHPKEGVPEIGKRLGAMWLKVSAKERKIYEDQAAKDKLRYEKELKKYNKKK